MSSLSFAWLQAFDIESLLLGYSFVHLQFGVNLNMEK